MMIPVSNYMKTYFFENRLSGSHSAERRRLVLERLYSNGITPEVLHVQTPVEIFACCGRINKESGPHLVIVAGGDGTINAVVNGLEPGSATVAVLPFGTSNVLAAEIGIRSIDDALDRIIAGKTASLSVGVLELKERSLRFLLMAGIGLDGAVVRDVWPLGKKILRQGAYALSALHRTFHWDKTTFNMLSSQGNIVCHSAIICNAARYGGNFILSPEVNPFSSGLSAVCITGTNRRTYLNAALNLMQSRIENDRNLTRVNSLYFEVKGEHPIQIDGDFVGYGPARISELIDFARIIV